jgi:hypothetical protein
MMIKLLNSLVSQHPQPLRSTPARGDIRTTAETAECTCPEFCERDHDND